MNKLIFLLLFLLNSNLFAQTRAHFKKSINQKRGKTHQILLKKSENTKGIEIERKIVSILKKYFHDTSIDITNIYKDYSPTLFDLKMLLRRQYYTDRFNKYYSNFSKTGGNNTRLSGYSIDNYTFNEKILSGYDKLLARFFKEPNIYYYEFCLKKSNSSLNLPNSNIVFEIFKIDNKIIFIDLDLLNHH